jgi:hypothetical protein
MQISPLIDVCAQILNNMLSYLTERTFQNKKSIGKNFNCLGLLFASILESHCGRFGSY